VIMRRMITLAGIGALILTAGGCATVGGSPSRLKALEDRVTVLEQELGRSSAGSYDTAGMTDDIVLDESIMRELEQDVSRKSNISASRGSSRTASVQKTRKNIQRALKNAGYYKGRVDGVLGKQSRRAISSFQRANGLRADGICGARTWGKLKKYL
jgi:hypothetical protein